MTYAPPVDRAGTLLAGVAVMAETFAAAAALNANLGQAAGLHLLAALVAAWAITRWCRGFGTDMRHAGFLLVALAVVVPLFGIPGLLWAFGFGGTHTRQREQHPVMLTRSPGLPFKPLSFDDKLAFSRGGLFDVLRHAADPGKRAAAVMATMRMRDRDAVPLLKIALRDPIDDVRLLAYSVKDKLESRINSDIKTNLAKLDDGPHDSRLATLRSLAYQHWELVYLDLADGDVRDFLLLEAERYARQHLEARDSPDVHLLLGRIEMTRGALDAAAVAFRRAREAGATGASIATYAAELAYRQRRFEGVTQALSGLDVADRDRVALRGVVSYWLKAA